MAKKKETPITEEQAVEEITAAEPTKEELVEQHISNQLKAINRMSNKARARRLAARVLNNRKGL